MTQKLGVAFYLKKIKLILSSIFLLVVAVIFTLGIFILINEIQEMLFVPDDSLMWTFNYPASLGIFIYEVYLILGMVYVFCKKFRSIYKEFRPRNVFMNKNRRSKFRIFIAINVMLFYMIISSVTVITENRIIDYSFLHPQGQVFNYDNIIKINTGVYGRNSLIPMKYSKGEFFYILELKNGQKVHLNRVCGTKDDEHDFLVIRRIDDKLVNRRTLKVSSMGNFERTTDYLDKIYTDKIQDILKNTN